ncbi:pesticidal protein Cry10Aa [Enterococcus avium]|uniref:HAD family hydrolase n=1 Tax=Enterococcus malodoratus TaxID=71451 RepID=UPI0008CFE0E9|nr:HAD family phosphatase [Enterococcus malodoratus]BBM16857.1 pesticidal protein Cry10Aa [Enterococcus avium]SET70884.1 haloacid dehalogenase superfamily, subfamily IA, variant 3 with third motif having DD or ED [Enterococcus malodoratus]
MKGIIFDFNGTMFMDSDLHEAAWLYLLQKYSEKELTEEDILKNLHGKTNDVILRNFISKDLTDEEVQKLSDEKEAFYRKSVLESSNHKDFTKGLRDVLDYLKANDIPMTIASASPKINMDFYFDYLNLGNWFDYDQMVCHTGSFPGKPAPDIFLIAAEKIGVEPENCLVIEDSYSGLQAAHNAKIGTIVAIDPDGKNRAVLEAEGLAKDGVIEDFTTFISDYLK